MIRCIMLGRLGNNLFQYAMGRVLSKKHGVPFEMDGSWFNREGWNQVNCIKKLPGPAAGKALIRRRFSIPSRVLRKLTGRHFFEFGHGKVIHEKAHDQSFDAQLLEAPSQCVLYGYFQSPLYFNHMEEELRSELCTNDLGLESGREDIAARLRQEGSVAVHVRRTDYVGNSSFDLLDLNYYQSVITDLRNSGNARRFFIFSDDPSSCARDFKAEDVEIVPERHGDSALVALHLMSLAHTHVIANSSYSWWAAWLGKKPQQKVIVPPVWLNGIHAPVSEKLCEGWEIAELPTFPQTSN